MSRIISAELTDEESEDLPEDFDLKKHMGKHFGIMHSPKMYTVKVRFAPGIAAYIRERMWHPTQKTTEHKDGSLTLTMRVNETTELKRWLLSWGKGVTVLGPKALAAEMKGEAEEMTRGYGG